MNVQPIFHITRNRYGTYLYKYVYVSSKKNHGCQMMKFIIFKVLFCGYFLYVKAAFTDCINIKKFLLKKFSLNLYLKAGFTYYRHICTMTYLGSRHPNFNIVSLRFWLFTLGA